jgi:hypothetical protein
VRYVSGLAAIGAGFIHLALVSHTTPVVGAILAVIGVAEFGWGLLVMFDDQFMNTRVVAIAAIVPLAAWIGLLATNASPNAFPLACASLLELLIAVSAAWRLRRRHVPAVTRRSKLVVLVVGVVAIALLTGVAIVTAGVPTVTDDWILYPHNH